MNVLHVARFTIQEAISRRLILAGVLISLAFVVLYALGMNLIYDHAFARNYASRGGPPTQAAVVFGAGMTVMGLYAVHFLSSFLALFLSVGAVSGEVDAGTLHAVLARPIRRGEFILGRWLAYVVLLGLYVAAMAGLLLLVTRAILGYQAPQPASTIGLMTLGAVGLLSLSLFGSTVLSTLANGVVVFTLFGLAWLAGIIEVIGQALENESMVNLGIIVSLLLPSDAVWRGASFFVQSPAMLAAMGASGAGMPFASASPPTTALLIWAACYPVVLLLAAIARFEGRDL